MRNGGKEKKVILCKSSTPSQVLQYTEFVSESTPKEWVHLNVDQAGNFLFAGLGFEKDTSWQKMIFLIHEWIHSCPISAHGFIK